MAIAVRRIVSPDIIRRQVMFAIEFVDPITGFIVGDGLQVEARGLNPPIRSLSGRYVWLGADRLTERQIQVSVGSDNGFFAPITKEKFTVPKPVIPDRPQTLQERLLIRHPLVATGLLEPPDGLTAVAGQLLLDNSRVPLPDVQVVIELRHGSDDHGNNGSTFTGRYKATTDPRGGFIAVVTDLGDIRPDRRSDGTVVASLRFIRKNTADRIALDLPILAGRLNRLRGPLMWEALQQPEQGEVPL